MKSHCEMHYAKSTNAVLCTTSSALNTNAVHNSTPFHGHHHKAMEDLKLGMLENKKAEEEGEEKNEGERKEDGFRLKLTTMTPALRALEKVIFVTGLALNHPHDYNINVTSWKNAEHKKFPAHNR